MTDQTTPIALLAAPTVPPIASDLRIYVACLAAYNSGILHGRWIDAALGEDHIWTETRAMLAASPVEDAEEWAIHDYDGFEGASLSEYESFSAVCALAEFIQAHGQLGAELYSHFGNSLGEANAAFEEYAGEYKSLEDFACELTEQSGIEIADNLAIYIDYAAMGRDMELSGDIFTIETGFEQVHIFWSR